MLLGPLHAQGYVTAAMPLTAPLGLFAPSDVSLPFRGRWAGRRHFSRWAFVAASPPNFGEIYFQQLGRIAETEVIFQRNLLKAESCLSKTC
jgi:hypothetical protein